MSARRQASFTPESQIAPRTREIRRACALILLVDHVITTTIMAATSYVSFKQVLSIGSLIFYILAPIQGKLSLKLLGFTCSSLK